MKYRVELYRTVRQSATVEVEVSIDEYPDTTDHKDIAIELAWEQAEWHSKTIDSNTEVKKL